MKKRQIAAARRGSALSEGSVRNDERQLPRDVTALFAGLLSRSTRAAQADHRLQTKVAQAAARLRREQVRLLGAQARQLGVGELVKDLAAAQERHLGTAIEAIEASHRSTGGRSRAASRKR
jgi:hypothetical protein